MSDGGHVWWEDAIVYQVYPRSFADADADGVGRLSRIQLLSSESHYAGGHAEG